MPLTYMRYSIGLLSLLLATVAVSATAAGSDDAAIRTLVQRYMDARNQKDEAALRQLFMPDADQLVSSGEWRRGLDALLKGAMASSKKEGGNSSVILESVRLIGTDTAIADGRYQTSVIGASSSPGLTRRMWSTFILRRTGEGWRIAAIRNMLPSPPQN